MTRVARVCAVGGLALCCGGCLLLPIPHKETAVGESRRKFSEEHMAFFQDGSVTREQVLLRFGEPDHEWGEGSRVCYGWATTDMALLVFVAAGYSGAGGVHEFVERQFLLLEFDGAGVLRRHEVRGQAGHRDAKTFVLQLEDTWPAAEKVGR